MGCGFDVWKPCGFVYNHPNFPDDSFVYTSTPVAYDKETKILTTKSGRIYQIVKFDGGIADYWEKEIFEDIARGGSRIL